MTLTVNGKKEEFEGSLTLKALLKIKNLSEKTVVAELNGEIISSGNPVLSHGDCLELIHMVGGG